MLKQLSLKSFKSWKKISNMRLAPITGLFGTNSSGKSSILQFLLLLKQTADSTDRTQIFDFGNEKSLVSLGSFRDVVHSYKETKEKHIMKRGKKVIKKQIFRIYYPLTWNLKWTLSKALEISNPIAQKHDVLFTGDEMDISGEIQHLAGQRFRIEEIEYTFSNRKFGMRRKQGSTEYKLFTEPKDEFKFLRTHGRAWGLPCPIKCYGFPDQVRGYYQNAGFLTDLELEFENLCSRIYYLGPLREHPKREYTWAGGKPSDMGQRGEKTIEALLSSAKREKISRGRGHLRLSVEKYVAYWLKKLGLIHSFSVNRISRNNNIYQVLVKKSPNTRSVKITDVGFGVSQILPVLAICYYIPEGSILLLEQPEIHLHPSVQCGLADVFIDAIEKRNIQIIVESHSEHLLKRLQRRIAEKSFSRDDAALYFCDIERGVSNLVSLEMDLFGNIINWPKDFFGDSFGEMAATSRAIMKHEGKQQG